MDARKAQRGFPLDVRVEGRVLRWLVTLGALFASSQAWAGGIAVLYFQNQGNAALEPLKVGLAQMLVTDLKSGDSELPIVERAELQAVLDELKLGHDGTVDATTAARVGKLIGAEYLVMGTYFELMGTLRIDTRVVEVETGRVMFAYGTNSPTSAFLSMEKDVAGALRAKLDTLAVPKSGSRSSAASAPTRTETASVAPPPADATPVVTTERHTIDAAVAYSEGLIHLDQKDLPRARESFEKAVAADPQLEAAKAELAHLSL